VAAPDKAKGRGAVDKRPAGNNIRGRPRHPGYRDFPASGGRCADDAVVRHSVTRTCSADNPARASASRCRD
jgi:hypothetical protein